MEKPSKHKTAAPKKTTTPTTLVVSSNDLVHAKYHMTLWQKRLFAFAVSQLKREDREFTWQRIHYSDLINYFEAGGGKKAYDAIREAPKHLDMTIEVPYRDEKGNLRYAFLKVLNGYTMPGDEGSRNQYVEIKFNDDLRPHLLALKDRFMGYDLTNVKRLRSVYSVRIFELLKSHEFQREVTLDVDYLREILQLQDSYRLYTDFRRNVIDKAQSDMREECDITFEYTEIKKGNKVVTLVFTILPNKDRRVAEIHEFPLLDLEPDSLMVEDKPILGEMETDADAFYAELEPLVVLHWGVAASNLAKLLKTYPADEIRRAMRVTKRKIASGEVGNKAGFFMAAVHNKFTDEEEAREQKKKMAQAQKTRLIELEAEANTLSEAFRKNVFNLVRSLTDSNPGITERAIGALKQNTHPLVRSKILSLGAAATIEDYRRDEYLREKVIDEIIRQNPNDFDPVYKEYQEKQQQIMLEYEQLKGR